MNFAPKLPLAALILFCISGNSYSSQSKKPNLFFKNGDFEASIIGNIATETGFDKNGILFNSNIPDSLFANKTKIDISFLTKTSEVEKAYHWIRPSRAVLFCIEAKTLFCFVIL